jgi:hypothetical protein
VAGAIAVLGAVDVAEAAGAVDLDVVLAPLSAVFSVDFGTALRAIGRGFGKGTLCFAAGSFARAYDPSASASVLAIAVERKAAARTERVTAFLLRRITKDLCQKV